MIHYLCAFLDRGEEEISNNQVENAIRPFVMGRKGWLFSDTPEGAEASAVIYSLMAVIPLGQAALTPILNDLHPTLVSDFCSCGIHVSFPPR